MAADAHRLRHQGRQGLPLGDDRDHARRHPGGPRRRARLPAPAETPLHRHHQLLPVLEPAARPAGKADRSGRRPLENRGKSPDVQAGHRPGQRPGHHLDILAPLDRHQPSRRGLPGRRSRLAARPRRQHRRPQADPHHRSRTAQTAPRHRHSLAPPRQGPPRRLDPLATPPPVPRPPGPPALARLRGQAAATGRVGCPARSRAKRAFSGQPPSKLSVHLSVH